LLFSLTTALTHNSGWHRHRLGIASLPDIYQREEFSGVMKERYGKSKEEAEQEFDKLRDSDS